MLCDGKQNPEEKSVLLQDEDDKSEPWTFWDSFKHLSHIAVPMTLSFSFSFEVFTSGVLLANVNPSNNAQTAAISLTSNMMNVVGIVSVTCLLGMALIASRIVGEIKHIRESEEEEEDNESKAQRITTSMGKVTKVYRAGLIVAAGFAPFGFLLLFFSKPILHNWFGQQENVASLAEDYLRPYAFAIPGLLSRMCAEQIMFSFQRSHAAMVIALSSFTFATLLALGLGYGVGALPQWRSKGVAIAYTIEAYITALAYTIYIGVTAELKDCDFFQFHKRSTWTGTLTYVKQVLRYGVPIGSTMANDMTVVLVAGILAGLNGQKQQASITYSLQLLLLLFIGLAAFSQTSAQEVGRCIGERKYGKGRKMAIHSLGTALIYFAPIGILVAAYPQLFMDLLNNRETNIKQMVRRVTPIVVVGILIDAVRFHVLQQLRSLSDMLGSTIISITAIWSGMLVGGLLSSFSSLEVYGVAFGYALGLFLAWLGLTYRWVSRIKPASMKSIGEEERRREEE
eukprot:gb/GECG01010200.1/.p1 GENE.gb/GECG01010200.1/~~gb/GECG01010200.1/.p1  ORF type:complete len:511 (+),score=35.40 gb/GECG01010200.1/:1-1533(+)